MKLLLIKTIFLDLQTKTLNVIKHSNRSTQFEKIKIHHSNDCLSVDLSLLVIQLLLKIIDAIQCEQKSLYRQK